MPEIKNKLKSRVLKLLPAAAVFFLLPVVASAHEGYVLTKLQVAQGMQDFSINVLTALNNPGNFRVGLAVGLVSLIGIILYFLFQISDAGIWFDRLLKKVEPLGNAFLRVAFAGSLIASAYFNAFLGPEISLNTFPAGNLIRIILYVAGFMILLGIFTEIAGIATYLLLGVMTIIYKDYVLTYYNYVGEAVTLIIFGAYTFSLDRLIRGHSFFAEKHREIEIAIIRVTYGISILYPAITIKLLHPAIIIQIANQYNLTQFHWLFPHDPLLISLGTGLAQIAVGICLILGFQTRLNTLVTFVLMTMSVLFFKEAVWPHFILLALALYLWFNDGGEISLDHFLLRKIRPEKFSAEPKKVFVEAQHASTYHE